MTKSHFMHGILCIFLTFALAACASSRHPSGENTVVVLYTTDTHGHIATDKDTIGLDMVAAVKKSLPGSVLLDAGDFLHGTALAGFDKGKSVASIMRKAGYDAATAGNHEFSQGLEALMERREEMERGPVPMPILSANIFTADGSPLLPPDTRLDVNGMAVCVFGLTTQETKTQSMPSTVADLTFVHPEEAARKAAERLRASGCGLVIALVHLGSDVQVEYTSLDLAAAVPELDAVIDGHSHREMYTMIRGTTPVVSSGSHGKAIGKLAFTLDSGTGRVLAANNTLLRPGDLAGISPDPTLQAEISALQSTVAEQLSQVVAWSDHALSGERGNMRTRETALGNLAADALRAAYGTETGIVNSGGIRADLPKGPVTRGDILSIFPFGGNVIHVNVTGAELLDILEHGVSRLPGADGCFPQISGIALTVRADAPAGKRVASVHVNGALLKREKTYSLAINEFLAQGGDGYPHLSGMVRQQSWRTVEEVVIRFIKKHGVPSPDSAGKRIHVQ